MRGHMRPYCSSCLQPGCVLFIIEGQKIAKRVSSQITKETRRIKSLLEDYSASLSPTESPIESILLSDALDPSAIEHRLQTLGIWFQTVASGEKREVMDAYLMLCRSNEDLSMLKEEAQNTVTYYEERKYSLLKAIEHLSSNIDTYSRGITAILHQMLAVSCVKLKQCHQVVQAMNLGNFPDEHDSASDSELEESDEDSQSEDDFC